MVFKVACKLTATAEEIKIQGSRLDHTEEEFELRTFITQ